MVAHSQCIRTHRKGLQVCFPQTDRSFCIHRVVSSACQNICSVFNFCYGISVQRYVSCYITGHVLHIGDIGNACNRICIDYDSFRIDDHQIAGFIRHLSIDDLLAVGRNVKCAFVCCPDNTVSLCLCLRQLLVRQIILDGRFCRYIIGGCDGYLLCVLTEYAKGYGIPELVPFVGSDLDLCSRRSGIRRFARHL